MRGPSTGFEQLILLPRHKLGIALLINMHQSRINLALENSLVDLFLGLPKKDWNAHFLAVVKKEQTAAQAHIEEKLKHRHPNTKPSLDLSAYAGTYEHPAYGKARVTLENGGLVLRYGSFRCNLEHFHFDTFLIKDDLLDGTALTFTLGPKGSVAAMEAALPFGVRFTRK